MTLSPFLCSHCRCVSTAAAAQSRESRRSSHIDTIGSSCGLDSHRPGVVPYRLAVSSIMWSSLGSSAKSSRTRGRLDIAPDPSSCDVPDVLNWQTAHPQPPCGRVLVSLSEHEPQRLRVLSGLADLTHGQTCKDLDVLKVRRGGVPRCGLLTDARHKPKQGARVPVEIRRRQCTAPKVQPTKPGRLDPFWGGDGGEVNHESSALASSLTRMNCTGGSVPSSRPSNTALSSFSPTDCAAMATASGISAVLRLILN